MSQSAANLASDAAEDSFVEAESSHMRLRKRNSDPTLYSGKKTRAAVFYDSPTNVNETHTAPQDALLDNSNDIAGEIIFPDEPLCDANDINSLKAQILEKDSLVEDLRSKLRGKDRKISKLQQKLSAFEGEQSQKSVEIGDGLTASAELVDDLKLNYKHNPGICLRKLMEKSNIFTLEEIAASSVSGQKHHGGVQRPRLDLRKFNACKEFTIRKCKLKEDSMRMDSNNLDVDDHGKDLTSPGDPSTASLIRLGLTIPDVPDETKEDVKTFAAFVEKKEKELGHTMTETELEQFENELADFPWFKRVEINIPRYVQLARSNDSLAAKFYYMLLADSFGLN